MKWLGRIVLLLIALALVAGGVVSVHLLRSMPQLDGHHQLQGLSGPVQVQRDASDVTHITASNALDAWRAMGWVHAQERGWQLEFNRRLMRGELSEILGAVTLDTDKLMRTLGIMQMAKVQLRRLSPQTRAALQAYSEGIAQAHASGAAGQSPNSVCWAPVRAVPAARHGHPKTAWAGR